MAKTFTCRDFPGVRFREHPTRRVRYRPHEGARVREGKDRYFFIRYQGADDQRKEEGVGWLSENITEAKAAKLRGIIKENIITGNGPKSLKEMREAHKLEEGELKKERLRSHFDTLTFGDVAGCWLMTMYEDTWDKDNNRWKPKPSAYDDELRLEKHILPVIGNMPATAVDTEHIDDLRLSMERNGLAPSTIKHVLGEVRRVYNYAARKKIDGVPLVDRANPVSGYEKMPKPDFKRERYVDQDLALCCLKIAKYGWPEKNISPNPKIHDIAAVAWTTGLRRGTIVQLESQHLLDNGILAIPAELLKTHKGLTVVPPEWVLELLKARKEAALHTGQPYLFPGRKPGTHYAAINATTWFTRIFRLLGVNKGNEHRKYKMVFHCFRHGFRDAMSEHENDHIKLMLMMGHTKVDTNAIYTHNEIKRQARKVSQAFPSPDRQSTESRSGEDLTQDSGSRSVA